MSESVNFFFHTASVYHGLTFYEKKGLQGGYLIYFFGLNGG